VDDRPTALQPLAPPSPAVEPDAYAVLGLSPEAEDVVVRAAYRALMHKYTTPGRLPDDPAGDDARMNAVQGAYDLLKDPTIRRAYDEHRREQAASQLAAAAPVVEPLVLDRPRKVAPAAARRRRRSLVPLLLGLLVLAGLGLAAVNLGRHLAPATGASSTSSKALAVQPQKSVSPTPAAAIGGGKPLPCYVDGRSVGSLPLKACAGRNGVATGRLDVGLGSTSESATGPSSPAASNPSQGPATGEGPSPQSAGAAPAASPAAHVFVPTPAPAAAPPVEGAESADVHQSMATVRAFYEALGSSDGVRAASLVEPEKRQAGPLSAGRINRFYGSLRAPLRLTSIYPLDPSTIFVRYQFVTAEGRPCSGAANVATTRQGDQVFIRGVRAYSGC
jgi:hypothetical protein